MKYYSFPCGCAFPILDESTPFPLLDVPLSLDELPRNCPAVYKLLGQGDTLGVFQFETHLGRTWNKKLKPENMNHIAALGALLRPGCLNAKDENNISMTEHYCLRKNREEPNEGKYPQLKSILDETYNVITYQEQAIKIAKEIAGFDLAQADILRRGIGKKDAKLLASLRIKFVEGCLKVGKVNEAEANEIFDWIKEGERYSFNKSHSVEYGHLSYYTAYAKVHGPIQFFTAKLRGARNKIDATKNITELIYNAKLYDVEVKLPDLRLMTEMFDTDLKEIRFGITDIGGIGFSTFQKIKEAINKTEVDIGKKLANWTYYDFLVYCFIPNLTLSEVLPLAHSGALNWLGQSRSKIEYDIKLLKVTDTEIPLLIKLSKESGIDKLDVLLEMAAKPRKEGGVCFNSNRVESLKSQLMLIRNPIGSQVDTGLWVSFIEEDLLGTAITSNKIDNYDLSATNTTCKEITCGKSGFMVVGADIKEIVTHKIKKGNNEGKDKAIITIADNTGMLRVIAWPEMWEKHKDILIERNSVILQVERGFKKYSDSIILKKAYQAS